MFDGLMGKDVGFFVEFVEGWVMDRYFEMVC
jgi:hypothetical protein